MGRRHSPGIMIQLTECVIVYLCQSVKGVERLSVDYVVDLAMYDLTENPLKIIRKEISNKLIINIKTD